jgi:hypothetical protein
MARRHQDKIDPHQSKIVGLGWAILICTIVVIALFYLWLDDPLQIEEMLGLAPAGD